MLSHFAAESGVPLSAEPIINFLGLHITNSMLFGLIMAVIVLVFFTQAAKRSTLHPNSKFGFAVESMIEFVLNIAEENFGDRKKALKFLPLLLTLFTFILFSNLSGLIPGVGTINIGTNDGVSPLLRPFTTDLNATLALAILTIGTVQFAALRELGVKRHLQHYFTNKPYNPMNLFIGLIEVMGEFIRVITLSMRLFGVIYAGEVLLHVIGDIAGNFSPIATLPVYLLEIFFCLIQAYVFMLLTTVYLAMATHHEDGSESDHSTDTPITQAVVSGAKSVS